MSYSQLKNWFSSKLTTSTGATTFPRWAKWNVAVELFFILLLSVPVLVFFGIGLLHSGLYTLILGSKFFTALLLPLAAMLLAIFVIVYKNPVHSLLSLIGVFVSTVLMFISFGAEYLAYVFLIVYVGAVAILFLFVVMLLNVKSLSTRDTLIKHGLQYGALALGLLLFARLLATLTGGYFTLTLKQLPALSEQDPASLAAFHSKVDSYNDILLFDSLYTADNSALFKVITAILLTSMLAAIILAAKSMEGKKHATTEMEVAAQPSAVSDVTGTSVFTPVVTASAPAIKGGATSLISIIVVAFYAAPVVHELPQLNLFTV